MGDVRLTLSSRWLKNYTRVESDHSLVSGGSGDSDCSSRSGYGSESSFLTADSDTDGGCSASERELDTDDELDAVQAAAAGLPPPQVAPAGTDPGTGGLAASTIEDELREFRSFSLGLA